MKRNKIKKIIRSNFNDITPSGFNIIESKIKNNEGEILEMEKENGMKNYSWEKLLTRQKPLWMLKM